MIHSSSVIDKKAKVGKNVKIGPFCFIGPGVEISEDVELISNVHIEGNTKIGKGTKIYPFASIGTAPQDLKYKGEENSLVFIVLICSLVKRSVITATIAISFKRFYRTG